MGQETAANRLRIKRMWGGNDKMWYVYSRSRTEAEKRISMTNKNLKKEAVG